VSYIDPGTGSYYVELTLCVTDAGNQPVPGDTTTISLLDGTGSPLGTTHAATDTHGCFSGDVQPIGAGSNVQPASVTISDSSGGSTTLTVLLGAPLVRPPRNPLPTP